MRKLKIVTLVAVGMMKSRIELFVIKSVKKDAAIASVGGRESAIVWCVDAKISAAAKVITVKSLSFGGKYFNLGESVNGKPAVSNTATRGSSPCSPATFSLPYGGLGGPLPHL